MPLHPIFCVAIDRVLSLILVQNVIATNRSISDRSHQARFKAHRHSNSPLLNSLTRHRKQVVIRFRSATCEIDDNLGNTMSRNRGDSDVVYGMVELAVDKGRIHNAWSQEMEQVRGKVLYKTSNQLSINRNYSGAYELLLNKKSS
jgi:hypothetical protein